MPIEKISGFHLTVSAILSVGLVLLAGLIAPMSAAAQCTHIDGGRLRLRPPTARSGARLNWRARDKSIDFLIADPRSGQTAVEMTAGGSSLATIEIGTASAASWRSGGSPVRLWRYSSRYDSSGVPGIEKILSKANVFTLTGKGGIVDALALPLPLPVTMKITDTDGACYLARFSKCRRNDSRGASCKADAEFPPETDIPNLVFQSGFEDQTQHLFIDTPGVPCTDDLIGRDDSVPAPNHWVNDLEGGVFGNFHFCFGGGDRSQRTIDLVADPDNPSNQVLHGRIIEPGEVVDDDEIACNDDAPGARKARIQAVLRNNPNLQRIDYQLRIRLGENALAAIKSQSQPINWLTIGEFWNNQSAEDGSFRITLNLLKDSGANQPFHFGLKSDKQPDGGSGWTTVWDVQSEGETPVEVPLGEWFTLRVTIIEGNATTGRVIVRMTDSQNVVRTIGDITNWTYSPDGSPDGFKDVNPLKLYTSGTLMCALKDAGLPLDIWWDDFAVGGVSGISGSAARAFLSAPTPLLD
jgi:hypothetical protein